MNKDQSTKEELKAQVEKLTTYIQYWTSSEEEAPTKSPTLSLLSKEEVNKIEKMKKWAKSTSNWFKRVINTRDKDIHYAVRVHNHFLALRKEIEPEEDTCKDFLKLYWIMYPKLQSILKLSLRVWEKELSLLKDDHNFLDTWLHTLEFRKVILKSSLIELEDIHAIIVTHLDEVDDLLKLMTGYDAPTLELDSESVKREFRKKVEQGTSDTCQMISWNLLHEFSHGYNRWLK